MTMNPKILRDAAREGRIAFGLQPFRPNPYDLAAEALLDAESISVMQMVADAWDEGWLGAAEMQKIRSREMACPYCGHHSIHEHTLLDNGQLWGDGDCQRVSVRYPNLTIIAKDAVPVVDLPF